MEEKRAVEFLREFVRLEGRGGRTPQFCHSCFDGLRLTVPGEPLFRCKDCWGTQLECLACILINHARLPFHRIRRWDGQFFQKVKLSALGLRLQLGHEDSRPCVNPQTAPKDFTILHDNGIHKVNADFCGCEQRVPERIQMLRSEVFPATIRHPKTGITLRLLETFDKISSSGKLSIYEHYQGLERLTDNTRIDLPKSRYKAYARVNRQFAHLTMLKRSGRGSVKDGIETTNAGDLAVRCPACPREGVNLPEDWQSLPPETQFLYRLLLALDANFRLKNLRRPGTHDPGLHSGLAYFVETMDYLAHIAKYPRQKDISSCAGFKTLAHAETKNAAGLQSMGVGMCLCARHEIVRPNGIGDLQKGERYCNMDYIALSGAREVKALPIFWSYDIACQWSIHLFTRMKALPKHLQLSPASVCSFGVPKCHCRGHKLACQVNYSMNVQPGVGQSCGEAPERVWNGLNASAAATKEMLPGGRRDMLDRRIGCHNWDKVSRIARHIHKKLFETYGELAKHELAHQQFTLILPPDDIDEWLAEVVLWESDKTKPNPYFRAQSHQSELSVRQALAEEERKAARDVAPLHETSASVMLSMMFILEDLVRKVEQLLNSEEKDTPAYVKDVHEKRCQIQAHLRQLRELQTVYMPCVAAKLSAAAGSRTGDVEEEKLWVPSELTAEERNGCAKGLAASEEVMRVAQCEDALETIRNMQAAKCTLIAFRKINVRGQRNTGRIHTTVKRLDAKSDFAVAKYRHARDALLELRGEGDWEKVLKPLLDADVKALDGMSFDIELPREKKKRKVTRRNPQLGSGSQTISWIWLMEGAVDGQDTDHANATVRVEWLKSRARVNRRREEVGLLGVEKERTLLSFEYEATEWEKRTVPWDGLDDADVDGLRALAARQADVYRSLARNALLVWSKPPKSHTIRVPDRVAVRTMEEEESEDEDGEDSEDDEDSDADQEDLSEARELAENPEDPTLDDD
ncbi:hypothetical protein BDZ89DRAFT_965772 [Hymenopellis radicata]|nr:hypothetical protein BDZ89DRAFT_965772 [Hymenopellis radicata]